MVLIENKPAIGKLKIAPLWRKIIIIKSNAWSQKITVELTPCVLCKPERKATFIQRTELQTVDLVTR